MFGPMTRTNGQRRAPGVNDDLARYRYHTGAAMRRLEPDEPCPVLLRDIGPTALVLFLEARLRRLAGPTSPILYMRTSAFREPYIDYESTGRLVFLQPKQLTPWHSGVGQVYVASADHVVDPRTVAYLPGHITPESMAGVLVDIPDAAALREVLGGGVYDEARRHDLAALKALEVDLRDVDQLAEPVRRVFQSGDRQRVDAIRLWMERNAVTEADLCSAWHHLPRTRRERLRDALLAGTPRQRSGIEGSVDLTGGSPWR